MLANAQGAVGALFDETVLEQLMKLLGNETYKGDILLRAQRFVEPFKTVVEGDGRRAAVSGQPQQLSATLTVQRRMTRMNPIPLHGKFLLWDEDNVVTSSLNWGSASSDPDFPLGDIGVHIRAPGIGESVYQRLVAIFPKLRDEPPFLDFPSG